MNTNKITLIAARVWTVLCAALVVVMLTHQNEADISGAIMFGALGCAPWALFWIVRGTLRR